MSLPARWAQKIEVPDSAEEVMEIQMGPSHPASHGTIKFNLKLDGETHPRLRRRSRLSPRAFEKMCEQGTGPRCFPTRRLNYASPCINNVGFALAVERLLGIEAPERCEYARMIMSEVSRITDHLTCLGMSASEVGAVTVAFYMMEARELLYDLVEAVTGARLTVSWCRVGGLTHDLPPDFADRWQSARKNIEGVVDDCDKLLSRNRVFIDRMSGIGLMSQKNAISYGLTGPLLRAAGIEYDVRKGKPLPLLRSRQFRNSTRREGR